MQYPIKVFLINEDMVQIPLMLRYFSHRILSLRGTPSGSESSLFFSSNLFGLVQDGIQHGFARMAYEANSSVALAEL